MSTPLPTPMHMPVPFAQHRATAHRVLANGIPGWPATLEAANVSHSHRLVERMLAAVLAHEHSDAAAPAHPAAPAPHWMPPSTQRSTPDFKARAAGDNSLD